MNRLRCSLMKRRRLRVFFKNVIEIEYVNCVVTRWTGLNWEMNSSYVLCSRELWFYKCARACKDIVVALFVSRFPREVETRLCSFFNSTKHNLNEGISNSMRVRLNFCLNLNILILHRPLHGLTSLSNSIFLIDWYPLIIEIPWNVRAQHVLQVKNKFG